jgi:glyoxylase-like metal-dependent hydrolase (beta-lactamase superfamily II)
MKQIVPGLWMIDEIGSQVHCYLWQWSDGATIIDTGYPKDAAVILKALVKQNVPLHSLQRIIVTHVDLDHSGGLAGIHKATRAKVACHTVEKEFLEHPLRRSPALPLLRPPYWIMSCLPAYRQIPVKPDLLMVDGQELPEGLTVIHTPGHTPGHISLLHKERRFLITGDAMSNRGGKLRAPLFVYTPDRHNAHRSIWKLAKKYGDVFETVVFGHGPPILSNGGKRVKALASRLFSSTV